MTGKAEIGDGTPTQPFRSFLM